MKTHIENLAILATLALATSLQADVVIGDWQGGTSEGWFDFGNFLSITDPANAAKYSFASGVVPGYAQSLQITQNRFNLGLALDLATIPADLAAFNNNHILNFTFSAPAALGGTTGGYMEIYGIAINAQGYGFHYLTLGPPWPNTTATGDTQFNQNGMPCYIYSAGSPFETQTVSVDYSSVLPAIMAGGEGFIQLAFVSNNDGGDGGDPNYFWMNNVTLSGGPVPEPATGVLALVSGVIALLMVRRRA